MKTIITSSKKETAEIAKTLAQRLKGGEIFGLIGDLGSGKTFFTSSLAKEIGVKDSVNSPTFVLMKIYNPVNKKIKNFCHIDAYRVKTEYDLISIGFYDYLKKDTIIIIEWANNVRNILPKSTQFIKFEYLDKNKRKIIFL